MKPGWTCVIADDEPAARQRLRTLLRVHPVAVVAEAANVPGAVGACLRHRPDILFLDTELGSGNGLEVLRRLEVQPAVVLVSTHDRYGARAYDVGARDYLLKPLVPSRLGVAMARVMTSGRELPAMDDILLVSEGRRSLVIPWFQVTHVEAEENYTRVYLLGRGTILVRRTLLEWERRLPGGRFLRIHRSLLVRLDLVVGIHAESRDQHVVELEGGSMLRVGRLPGARIRRALRERRVPGHAA